MEPPEIVRYRRPKARLSNKNRKNINEYGLMIPSKKNENYEPDVKENALLWNSGLLTGKSYNFKNTAKANKKNTWNEYSRQRKNMAKKNITRKNKNNNGTRKKLSLW